MVPGRRSNVGLVLRFLVPRSPFLFSRPSRNVDQISSFAGSKFRTELVAGSRRAVLVPISNFAGDRPLLHSRSSRSRVFIHTFQLFFSFWAIFPYCRASIRVK